MNCVVKHVTEKLSIKSCVVCGSTSADGDFVAMEYRVGPDLTRRGYELYDINTMWVRCDMERMIPFIEVYES